MFGKKKKEPKVEKVFEETAKAENDENASEKATDAEAEASVDDVKASSDNDLNEMFGIQEEEVKVEDNLTPEQKEKYEKLGNLREKISKILKSSNIEIIDENIGDEYELDVKAGSKKQQQEDYDSLKALFGSGDKNKKQELTLTIDEFDYTFVGQYVDEYDVMHIKNIKRIHFEHKKPKHFKAMIAAACAVVVIAIGSVIGYNILKETPVYLSSVALNQTSNYYYVDETFDYTGLYLIASYSDGTSEKLPLSGEYLNDVVGTAERTENQVVFKGGVSVTLRFVYGGYTVEYTVYLRQKTQNGISVIYTPGLFNLSEGDVITSDYLIVMCEYKTTDTSGNEIDYGLEKLNLNISGLEIKVDGTSLQYVASKNGFEITSSTETTTNSTIVVSYGGYSVTLTYDKILEIVSSN